MNSTHPIADSSHESTSEQDIRSRLLDCLFQQRQERQELSRQVHDDIGQFLTSISINSGLLARHCTQGQEKELISAITSAAKMACRSTRDLTIQLGHHGVGLHKLIEQELGDLALCYDIDGCRPGVDVQGSKTLESAPLPLVQSACLLFEQFLCAFLRNHRGSAYKVALVEGSHQAGQAAQHLTLTALGTRLHGRVMDLEQQQLKLQLISRLHGLQLDSVAMQGMQQWVLRVDLLQPSDKRQETGTGS